jgi:hypothetical protein
VQRLFCQACHRYCSRQTTAVTHNERKSHLNQRIIRMHNMGVSGREIARELMVHRETVAKKLERYGRAAAEINAKVLAKAAPAAAIVFDEMETFEHSKLKPLAIVVAVEDKTRRILAAEVAQMPAKGLLAARSRQKYGRRADHRPKVLRRVLTKLAAATTSDAVVKSDLCPRYPQLVKECLPGRRHCPSKGRRACTVGQGELKRGGFDPLFSLNHSCAMARDRIKRLTRRTWCTTKRPDRLQAHLELFIYCHNQRLLRRDVRVRLPLRCAKRWAS